MASREDVIRFYRERNDYRDKEPAVPATPDPDPEATDDACKAIVVAYVWGDRVRLRDVPDGEKGRVVLVEAGPCGVRYEVSWPESREFSQHFDFELEDAE